MMHLSKTIHYDLFDEEEGVYFPKSTDGSLSYPDEGNNICFDIEDESFWFNHRNRIISLAVAQHPPEDKIIFDVGGGNGCVSSALQNRGFCPVLFEPGLAGAKNAKKRNLKNVFCSVFNTDVVNEHSVGAIGLFDVIEHIEDDTAFLQQMHTTLKKDGLVYLTVPAYDFLWSAEDEYSGHYRRYTLEQLCHVLDSAGFDVVYATYFFWFIPVPAFLLRKIFSGKKTGVEEMTPERLKKGHVLPSYLAAVINTMLSLDSFVISRGKKLPFGGSILVTAKAR